MVGEQWTERFADGIFASITFQDESDKRSLYGLDVRLDYGTKVNIATPGNAQLIETNWADSGSALCLSISVPTNSTIERVLLDVQGQRAAIFLPSSEVLNYLKTIDDDDAEAISRIATSIESPVRLPIIYGSYLDIQKFIPLLERVVEVPEFGTSQLHSFRYSIIRAAVTDGPGLDIQSKEDLTALIDGLNGIEQVGDLNVLDAVGDVMATVHDTPDDTDALLESLGFDERSIERQDDGFLLLCYLSLLLDSKGVEAAEGYAMRRRWRTSGNYKRRVIEAQNAEFPNRGSAWRSLVCAAARHGRHEFAYILANACYWSARTRQTDSRVTELLYRGAIEAASEIDLDRVELRARFGNHLAIAHRLRSSRNFDPALTHFKKAEQLTNQHQNLPAWRARYARGICESHALFDEGKLDASFDSLDETITELPQFEIDEEYLTEAIHHLKAQKHEKLGDVASDPGTSVGHYKTAVDHYKIIGFNRSKQRCLRKSDKMKAHIPGSGNEPTQVPESTSPHVSTSGDQSTSADMGAAPVSEPLPPELWAAETGQYPARRDGEQIPESEAGVLGSRSLNPIPDDNKSTESDDPYIF